MMKRRRLLTALPPGLFAALCALDADAGRVTQEGWDELSADKTFYIEVPMIDDTDLKEYGIGRNIVAESIINSVRYADKHQAIRHVVFKMDTGGGYLFHADAMKDVIERHHQNTEYHIVVQNAISAGIWTAFSCDTIFMCRAGTIGGATAYRQTPDGEVVVSDDIPEIADRLALTAERNGYPGEVIEPLMLMQTELHTWVDDEGKRRLSHDKPDNYSSLTDYKQLDRSDTVLTLTTDDAIEIGIARPIDRFDTSLVGDELGVPGWTPANRYGQVVDEIGELYNKTRAMEDQWVERKKAQDRFPVTPQNKSNRMIERFRENIAKYEKVVGGLREINEALNKLPDVHPERQIYLAGGDGQTVVADLAQWEKDTREARQLANQLNNGLRDLSTGYSLLEIDEDNLELIDKQAQAIISRINGIATHGNAAYWEREAE